MIPAPRVRVSASTWAVWVRRISSRAAAWSARSWSPVGPGLGPQLVDLLSMLGAGLAELPAQPLHLRLLGQPTGRSSGEQSTQRLRALREPLRQHWDMRPPLTIAAVQPSCAAGDASANGRVHADAVRAAQARVIVFPELSLTGYELDADAVSPSNEALTPIVEACAATGSVALVGAPIQGERGRLHIATLSVSSTGVEVATARRGSGTPSRSGSAQAGDRRH